MSRIDELIAEHCPDGVPFKELGSLGKRNKGTSITAGQMKGLQSPTGTIRVFAAGSTVADVEPDAVPAKDVIWSGGIIVKSRGNIAFERYELPFTHKSELWSYTITDHNFSEQFVYYFLLTQQGRLQDLARSKSVKLPQLSVGDTDKLLIPAPPLEVQLEIVRILDAMTSLQAELQAELAARRSQYEFYRDSLLSFNAAGTPPLEVDEVG